jgi:hypothetical protein
MYNALWKFYTDYIPVDTIYKETRHYAYNIVNGMTSKILNTAGLVEAQYCHTVTTNKEILTKILVEETNQFKREKIAKAITELDGEALATFIEEYKKEQENVSAIVGAVIAASVPSGAIADAVASGVVANVTK